MLYLVGGPPRIGKSTLARKLAADLSIPWLSLDDLRSVVLPYIPRPEVSRRMPFQEMYQNCDNDRFFSCHAPIEIVRAELTEAKTLWPGIKSLIEQKALAREDYIFEGVQLLPSLVAHIIGNLGPAVAVYLVDTDEKEILRRIQRPMSKNDWLLQHTKDNKTFVTAAKVFRAYGSYYEKEANKHSFITYNPRLGFGRIIQNLKESASMTPQRSG